MNGLFKAFGTRVTAILNWWFGELSHLVPAVIRRPFLKVSGILILDISGPAIVVRQISGRSVRDLGQAPANPKDPAAEAADLSPILRKAKLRKLDVVLRLSPGNALRKSLDLPLAAEENLREVLSFEMDRQTPFTADQVYFDCRILERRLESQRLVVDLIAVPKGDVDAALRRLSDWRVSPDIVDILESPDQTEPTINLLPEKGDRSAGSRVGRLSAALAVIAVMLASAAVYIPLERQQRLSEVLATEAGKARVEAVAASKLRDQVARLLTESEYLARRRGRAAKAVVTLAELTKIIPDHTWLQQLRINDGTVRLTGFSEAASSLIGVIERSPGFTGVRFRSPVTRDARQGMERFTISATIVESEPK